VILYCATTNAGKLREFRLALEHFAPGRIQVVPAPERTEIKPCEETGATFEENAIQKAVYYSRHAPGPLFADDSGLEVKALDGAPGVVSARFAGPKATDEDNNRMLLARLYAVEDRAAAFVCVIALAEMGRLIRTFRGTVEGRIIDEPSGANGFGYDPLFFYPPFGCTFGQVSGDRKLEVSHRGAALAAMAEYLLHTSGA
jgi:XTP/dITP diphosphohydrolase